MSWIRLLSTSRSFSGQDVEPRGYRLTQMNLIPKFGNNTAGARAPGQSARMAAGAATTRKLPTVVPLPRAGQGTAPPAPPAGLVRATSAGWRAAFGAAMEFCGRLLARRPSRPFAVAAAPRTRAAARPAQPELRLDAVRPVHNDLSDCDVEVRPVRRAPEPLPPVREAGLLAAAGEAAGRVRNLFR